ncbi:SRPBCC family protein [Halorarius halobius]|uniref:SRPBCC family protein n=1 Tax=Halorarius halobius TaxID=2962671 RepID=UPI0020CCB9BA|nr:SRPBCC family protein [Halorarius halobius]
MPTYHRETWVDAPLEDVWAFHSRIEGLTSVTPEFMNLRVERVVGPDGEEDPGILAAGTRIEMSMRPFDVGPRQTWTSVITEREESDEKAHFVDVMEDGPFPHWEHTHRFYSGDDADTGETLVSDRVEFELPFGALGEQAAQFADLGFEPMFRSRHRRTKQLLEREQIPAWVHGDETEE